VQPRGGQDGHTESVSVKLTKKAKPEEIIEAWNAFPQSASRNEAAQRAGAAGAVHDAQRSPPTRLDVDAGNGMTTTVGRLRPCGVLDWKFTVLSHNTIRGRQERRC